MSYKIRPAKNEDIPWIDTQLEQFSHMWGTAKSLFSPDRGYREQTLSTILKDHVFILVEKDEVGPVGLICGIFYNHHFNPQIKVLSEQFWWVAEEYRESRAGAMLLKEFEAIGQLEADWTFMSLLASSTVRPEALEKRGYKLREHVFVRESVEA